MSSRLNPLVSGIVKKETIRLVKQMHEYNMKAPPTPKEEMMVGAILTDTKSEMLSRIPNKPEPKLLMS